MGLLSFLTGRRSGAAAREKTLKSQPYNATVASLPPTRGVYPVAGNGPNILEALNQSHNLHGVPQSPSIFEQFGQLPAIRDDASDRPQSAPAQEDTAWSKPLKSSPRTASRTASFVGPPVSLHNGSPAKARGELLNYAEKRPPYKLPAKEGEAALSEPAPSFARPRTASVKSQSSSTSRAHYVDLLDAQSAISRVDFHHRLQAAGTRDYGEDVADRNMGKNGRDVASSEPRAFCATLPPLLLDNSASTPAVSRLRNDLGLGSDSGSRKQQRHSLGISLQTANSLTSGSSAPYPARSSSHLPYPPPVPSIPQFSKNDSKSAASRKSLHSYSTPSPRSSSSKRAGRETEEFPEMPKFSGGEMTFDVLESGAMDTSRPSTADRPMARDHVNPSAKSRASATGPRLIRIEAIPAVDQEERSRSNKAYRRETVAFAPRSGANPKSSKRVSLQSLYSTNSRRPHSSSVGLDDVRRDLGSTADLRNFVNNLPLRAASPPYVASSPGRPDSRGGLNQDSYARNRGVYRSDRSTKRFEIEDSIPERTSSIRKWSMESGTISSLSSYPFRPQSRHTATTSVDLDPYSKALNSSCDSLDSESRFQARLAAASMPAPREPPDTPKVSQDFNIDDYISSDDDSVTPQRPRGEGEEDLLFSDDGYWFGGAQLPGIPGAFDPSSPRPAPPLSPPRTATRISTCQGIIPSPPLDSSDDDMLDVPYSLGTDLPDRLSGLAMPDHEPAYADGNDMMGISDDESSDDNMSFDIPMTRRHNSLPARHYCRSENRYAGDVEDTIQEENDADSIDIATLIKLRTQAKRQSLLNGLSLSSRRSHSRGKENEALSLAQVDADGFDADVD